MKPLLKHPYPLQDGGKPGIGGGSGKPVFNLVAHAGGQAGQGATVTLMLGGGGAPGGAVTGRPAGVLEIYQEQADGSKLPVSTLARALSK